jgi:hypothetical protein
VKLKPVVLLLGLYFSAPVYAIGLGDLAVRSHLGQPLHATVEILSAPPSLAADCLSLRASDSGLAAPSQARFRIERTGENALLHITTPKAVNDPIAQFVLVSDCEGRLQREYVVLLDPPAVIAPAVIAPVALAEPQAGTASTPTSVPLAPAATPPAPAAVAKTASPAAATATSSTAAKPAATARPSRPAQRQLVAQTATPRLVISGKDTLPEAGSLPAGLENEALPKSSTTRTSELSATELSDENTALNRRLAYLEAQLAALHKRNEELEARRAVAEASAPKPVADQPPQWPLYLLGLGLLASGGLLASWLTRRRSLPQDEVAATVLWARPNNAVPSKAGVDDLDAPLPRLEPMLASDSLAPMNPAAPAQEIEEISLTALSEGTEVKEEILDQAEVFVAHGHANLAIHMLQEHLRQAPDESPMPWLLLLDLLRREGDEAAYAAASDECQRHFNINLAAHPMARDLDDSHGLENYPHLLEMLTQAWNTPAIDALFDDLIYDQRGGTRLGFEPGAYRDILLLRDIAQQKALAMAA